jgi:hypothetical protein
MKILHLYENLMTGTLKLKWDYVHAPSGCFMQGQVDAYETFGLRTERTIKNSLSCLLLALEVVLLELQYQQKLLNLMEY